MPLSRLTPRNRHSNAIARSRLRKRGPAPKSRHLHLWEAIRRSREELDSWQALVEQVDALFRAHILPREQSLTDQFCAVTERLIEHFSSSDLSLADQSLLGLWITENLESLNEHPFVSAEHRDALRKRWGLLLSRDGLVEQQLARMFNQSHAKNQQSELTPGCAGAASSDTTGQEENDWNEDDVIFDFGWHKKPDSKSRSTESGSKGNTQKTGNKARPDTDAKQASDQATEPGPEQVNETVKSLERRLSVDRLFRQLARVLHPDREQDEQLKADKHELMSQCLKARQEKDIDTLLSLYCEYVGELPDDLTDDSHESLIKALQLQLSQLQRELRNKRFGDPLHRQIIERYCGPDESVRQQRIDQHAKSLDIEILHLQALVQSLASDDGLNDSLEERRAIEYDRLVIDEITGLS